jgi:hypothetical protein
LAGCPAPTASRAGLTFADSRGTPHGTSRLSPDFQGCRSHDPPHDWQSVQRQYDGGRCDGWLLTQPSGDTFPIGYYTAADLPTTATESALGHTALDRYFCSVMGVIVIAGPEELLDRRQVRFEVGDVVERASGRRSEELLVRVVMASYFRLWYW